MSLITEGFGYETGWIAGMIEIVVAINNLEIEIAVETISMSVNIETINVNVEVCNE